MHLKILRTTSVAATAMVGLATPASAIKLDEPKTCSLARRAMTGAVLSVPFAAAAFGPAASSQTACPVGTTPGSATCGPSPGSQIPAPPPRPSGEWIKTWGAIATSTSGGGGASSQRLSKDDAEQLALRNCIDSGAANCRIEFSYYNQCVALAYPVGKNGGKVNTAATVERAKTRVLAACEKELGGECKVALAECSEPVFRKF